MQGCDLLLKFLRGIPWESLWSNIYSPTLKPHSMFRTERPSQMSSLPGPGNHILNPHQDQGAFIQATFSISVWFSVFPRLQDANCGLRLPVRAIKTSWQGGKFFICPFLMGQHKADRFSELPWDHQSLHGQMEHINRPGKSLAAGKQTVASAPPGEWGGWKSGTEAFAPATSLPNPTGFPFATLP